MNIIIYGFGFARVWIKGIRISKGLLYLTKKPYSYNYVHYNYYKFEKEKIILFLL